MTVTIKADTLSTLLIGASQAIASPKDSKGIPFIGIVRLELADNTVTATGTDRYVVARGSVTGLNGDGSGAVNLAPATLKAIGQLLKPLKDKAVTITLGDTLTIECREWVQFFDSLALDNYPKISQLIPTEFSGLDRAITFDPAVMAKACKVTAASVSWQFNGALKGAYGTATDTHGIEWDLMVMPLRVA
jgi:DNA polymerase III sliding clamp (beta) subunit (PCNA family)